MRLYTPPEPELRCGSFYDGPMGHKGHQKIENPKTVGRFLLGSFGGQDFWILKKVKGFAKTVKGFAPTFEALPQH